LLPDCCDGAANRVLASVAGEPRVRARDAALRTVLNQIPFCFFNIAAVYISMCALRIQSLFAS
jgi:hypothetical protein